MECVLSATKRAAYATRFLRPPGFFKRMRLLERPRPARGPLENPVRRAVRLREKAAEFCDLPPPRRVPVAKPNNYSDVLPQVTGVPQISPEALENRLEFLLGPRAVAAQMNAPLVPGLSAYQTQITVYKRQMRELARVYRAQYLQRLEVVVDEENKREREEFRALMVQRKQKRNELLIQRSIDLRRKAILQDRKKIEAKLTVGLERKRRFDIKKRKTELALKALGQESEGLNSSTVEGAGSRASPPTPGDDDLGLSSILTRNINTDKLMRDFVPKDSPVLTKSERFPNSVLNAQPKHARDAVEEALSASFDFLPQSGQLSEAESDALDNYFVSSDIDVSNLPAAQTVSVSVSSGIYKEAALRSGSKPLTPEEQAELYYSGFSVEEKLELVESKLSSLYQKAEAESKGPTGAPSALTQQLIDLLAATKAAHIEKEQVENMKTSRKQAEKERRTRNETLLDSGLESDGDAISQTNDGSRSKQ